MMPASPKRSIPIVARIEGDFLESRLPVRAFATLTTVMQASKGKFDDSFCRWVKGVQAHNRVTVGWIRAQECDPQRHAHVPDSADCGSRTVGGSSPGDLDARDDQGLAVQRGLANRYVAFCDRSKSCIRPSSEALMVHHSRCGSRDRRRTVVRTSSQQRERPIRPLRRYRTCTSCHRSAANAKATTSRARRT